MPKAFHVEFRDDVVRVQRGARVRLDGVDVDGIATALEDQTEYGRGCLLIVE